MTTSNTFHPNCANCGKPTDFGQRGDDAIEIPVLAGHTHPLEESGAIYFCGDPCAEAQGFDCQDPHLEYPPASNAHHNHLADIDDPAAYKKHLAELAAYQQHLADLAR